MNTAETEIQRALTSLEPFGRILAVKLYRVTLDSPPMVPTLPCLDHEAKLHQRIPPHAAVYMQEHASGDLHELVLIPARRRLEIDTVSTSGEHSVESQERLLTAIARHLPGYAVTLTRPSWWSGDTRVASACRAQVSLREVLLGADLLEIGRRVDRLQTISVLMEKQSRVTSWGVRTVTGPLVAGMGFVAYEVLGSMAPRLGVAGVSWLQYTLVGLLSAAFLYYGVKAVQLTEMANRVWKRAAEYSMILSGRQRLEERT